MHPGKSCCPAVPGSRTDRSCSRQEDSAKKLGFTTPFVSLVNSGGFELCLPAICSAAIFGGSRGSEAVCLRSPFIVALSMGHQRGCMQSVYRLSHAVAGTAVAGLRPRVTMTGFLFDMGPPNTAKCNLFNLPCAALERSETSGRSW